ncbi:MAG: hypothetical protein JOZ41_08585 [Chloroflexi bacterium]|nr:hypothetical protein [Chloroflexota bacterium]
MTVWQKYSLGITLAVLFVIAWALMTWTGWMDFAATQHEHGETAQLFGSSGYIWEWITLTLENWQSDILGNAAVVILSAYLLYQGSGMSRGGDDEIEQGLQRIQQALQQPRTPAGEQVIQQTRRETRPRQA